MNGPGTTHWLSHNKVTLALHHLIDRDGPALLLLHGLGEQTKLPLPPWLDWPGSIWGLDFTGHGSSSVPAGGGYTCETLMADVDVALAHIGAATVLGRGLGAYIAMMVAGARPDLVRGAVLADGPGLFGGGPGPPASTWFVPADADGRTPDPYALYELSNDIRPPDYATAFVHLLLDHSSLEAPLLVTARNRPAWLAAVATEPGVVAETADGAYGRLLRTLER